MPAAQAQSMEGGGVGAQLVGDRQSGYETLLAEQLAHQLDGRPLVTATLDQDIEDFAFLIDGAPQIQALAGDPHDHFVQMPAVAGPRPALPQSAREERAELQHPAPDRFVGKIETPFGQKLLDIAVAQCEAEIQPDRVLDDRRREAVAAVGKRGHAASIAYPRPNAMLP